MKILTDVHKIDLHMHTMISDGTDTPAEIISNVKKAGIGLFSATDHDAIRACGEIKSLLKEDDPMFISGIELSCRDKQGKYHILGYGYDDSANAICTCVKDGHELRIMKAGLRLDYLKDNFGIVFTPEDVQWLYSNTNPGKPHIANLMVKHGYAQTIKDAFARYLTKMEVTSVYIHPEEAIDVILKSGGIPILAHPSYGSGDELIVGEEMEARLQRLISFGLRGVEAFYSGFTDKLQAEILGLAEKYKLYVTAGSDYHGKNKMIALGDNNLDDIKDGPAGMMRFLEDVPYR